MKPFTAMYWPNAPNAGLLLLATSSLYSLDLAAFLLRKFPFMKTAAQPLRDTNQTAEKKWHITFTIMNKRESIVTFRFPGYAKQAICSKKECYASKCAAHFTRAIFETAASEKIDAVLFYGTPSDEMLQVIQSIPEAGELPHHTPYEVTIIHKPEAPRMEDYLNN